MKPIMQKNMYNPQKGIKGDCYRACICSLLEISDKNVPNFIEDPNYPMNVVEFLKRKGYRLRHSTEYPSDIEYCIANGLSPRGVRHSVIYSKGKLVHDPHPNGGDVVVDLYLWLEPREVIL
jgi:hypothetical protein